MASSERASVGESPLAANITPTFLRFRESHHAVAKMFASGMTISKVAHSTGYTRRRLHLLLSDPSFQELIIEYAKSVEDKIDEASDTYAELAIANMLRAEAQIQERLDAAEAEDETLPMRELLAIAKDRADRFGYGPKSTRVNVNVDFATQLDRAIERTSKVIEARPLHPNPLSAPTEPVVEPRLVEHRSAPPQVLDAPERVSRASHRPVPSFTRVLRREVRVA
jgi:hypothetical protein